MTDELRHYWTLHGIDERAVELATERGRIPEQRRALEARIATEQGKVAKNATRAAQLEKRRRELEAEIAVLESREQAHRKQLDAVTDQRQFEAKQHEIAGVAAKRSDLETEALTLMDDEAMLATQKPVLADALAKAQREAGEALEKLAATDADLAARLADLDARRAAEVAHLADGARKNYERLRSGRGGRALAAIERGSCGGCGRSLPPHMVQEARKRDRLLICDGCGLQLLMPPEDEPGA